MVEQISQYDEGTRLHQLVDRVMKSIRFERVITDSPIPILRLEVEFDEVDYLRQLGDEARRKKLINGFTIDPREANYIWEEQNVRKDIFVLRTTISRGAHSTALVAYDHFYTGIKEKWAVPLVYIDRSMSINPDFVEWLESVNKRSSQVVVRTPIEQRHIDAGIWTYAPDSPYIHLWDDELELYGNTHEEFVRIWEDRYVSRYRGKSELRNPHLAVVATHRNHEGLIPQRTIVLVYSDARREVVYESISHSKGLRDWDRERLEAGKYRLTFEFVDRTLSQSIESLKRIVI